MIRYKRGWATKHWIKYNGKETDPVKVLKDIASKRKNTPIITFQVNTGCEIFKYFLDKDYVTRELLVVKTGGFKK